MVNALNYYGHVCSGSFWIYSIHGILTICPLYMFDNDFSLSLYDNFFF